MGKTFMILGGSVGQVKAIETVKKLGMKALVLDRNENAIGRNVADYFEAVDIINFEKSKEIAEKYKIVGSMTISSDVAVPTSSYINEKLNLPSQGFNIGRKVTDKILMRQCFDLGDVNSPIFFEVCNEKELECVKDLLKDKLMERSYIVKPSDSSGSRGVNKIDDVNNLERFFLEALKFSRNKKVIVEEFIEGTEIGAQAFSINGEMKLCLLHNDTVSHNLIPVGHSFPIDLSEKEAADAKTECEKALKSLGIINGPSNIDMIIDKKGIPYIIEIGARIGATRLPELVEAYTKIDIVELAIRLASGQIINIPGFLETPCAAKMLYFNKESVVKKVNDYGHLIDKYQPLDYEILLEENTKITELLSGADNYGYVMFKGENHLEAEKRCNMFFKDLNKLIEI